MPKARWVVNSAPVKRIIVDANDEVLVGGVKNYRVLLTIEFYLKDTAGNAREVETRTWEIAPPTPVRRTAGAALTEAAVALRLRREEVQNEFAGATED